MKYKGGSVRHLSLQETYFQQFFSKSPEGIVLLDSNNNVIDINKSFQDIFQYSLSEIKGSSLDEVIVPDNYYIEARGYTDMIDSENILQAETVRMKKDHSLVNVSILVYPIEIDRKHRGIIGIYKDISERKRTEEEIKYLSFHDKLTGLYNRAFFDEELIRLDTQRQLPLSIIMGDANELKLTNDVFGHLEGDRLLIRIAEILKHNCREEDITARWGGDEFLILLPHTDLNTTLSICDRIRNDCEHVVDMPVSPSIALGAASKIRSTLNIQKVLREAERRMYQIKLLEQDNTRHMITSSLEKHEYEKNCKNREQSKHLKGLEMTIGAKIKSR